MLAIPWRWQLSSGASPLWAGFASGDCPGARESALTPTMTPLPTDIASSCKRRYYTGKALSLDASAIIRLCDVQCLHPLGSAPGGVPSPVPAVYPRRKGLDSGG